MSKFEFEKGKMVPYPSRAIVPDRDVNETPALECIHLGIEFGGLKAVDDFNLTIGKTEIAGLMRTIRPEAFLTVPSAVWRSCARLRPIPRCCCWTSPRQA